MASVMLTQNEETGQLRSMSVWTKGVDTLLPQTTHIAFVSPSEEAGGKQAATVKTVTWEDAVEVVGDAMAACGMYPERYRVNSFPSDEQIQRMNPE